MTTESNPGNDHGEYPKLVEISTEGIRELNPNTGDPIEEEDSPEMQRQEERRLVAQQQRRDRRDAISFAIQAHPGAATDQILNAADKMCSWLSTGAWGRDEMPQIVKGKPGRKAKPKAGPAKKSAKKVGPGRPTKRK